MNTTTWRYKQEVGEVGVVEVADTCVDPRAVVVHLHHTSTKTMKKYYANTPMQYHWIFTAVQIDDFLIFSYFCSKDGLLVLVRTFSFRLVFCLNSSKQFFSHVGTEPLLPGYYQYFWEVNESC